MAEARRERIAKRLARQGLCSRREAERWIQEGRVAVDGRVLTSPAVTVTGESLITVDGRPLTEPEATRLWRYHKPRGLITAEKDAQGRATVFAHLPPTLPRVIAVGRLDLDSEGLLLLTNDGGLARRLELPATGWRRRYRARVHGEADAQRLAALGRGVTVAGVRYGPIQASLERRVGRNSWLTVSLAEGRNREVRRVLGSLGLQVNRLIRVAYGPFELAGLAPGAVKEVRSKVLAEHLGVGLGTAKASGRAHRRR